MSNFDYPIAVGDKVTHVKDTRLVGRVIDIDTNLPHPTTCRVRWSDGPDKDIQWTNRIIKIS